MDIGRRISSRPSGKPDRTLEVIEASWKPIAAILVPLAVAVAPAVSNFFTSDRGVDAIVAKEAISIVQKPIENENDTYVRDWALSVIEKLSQTQFSKEARDFLRNQPGPIAPILDIQQPLTALELHRALAEAKKLKIDNILSIAASQIDQFEIEGGEDNPQILEYFSSVNWPKDVPLDDEIPWNAAFMNWVVEKAGHRGTRSATARSFDNWGIDSRLYFGSPIIGCIAVFWRQNKPPSFGPGTVGIYIGDDSLGNMRVLSGNVRNSVDATNAPRENFMSCRLPPNWTPPT